jgi:hypothetical protein
LSLSQENSSVAQSHKHPDRNTKIHDQISPHVCQEVFACRIENSQHNDGIAGFVTFAVPSVTTMHLPCGNRRFNLEDFTAAISPKIDLGGFHRHKIDYRANTNSYSVLDENGEQVNSTE